MAFSVRSLHRVGKRAYSQASAPLPNVYRHLHEPYGHRDRKPKEVADPRQAFEEVLKPEKQLFFQSAGATPTNLIQAAVDVAVANKITDIESSHIHIEGTAPHLSPEARSVRWRDYNFFTGSNSRKAVQQGEADYIPIFLSEIPLLYRKGLRKVDVALISVSPPDKHGYCSLGPSVDVTRAALQCADVIVAQINKEVPRVFGDGSIHVSHLDYVWRFDQPMHSPKDREIGPVEDAIGRLIAEQLVQDGATLQMGIGGIPDAVLRYCQGHKDLGIHSEMFSDGVMKLHESGVVTGVHKASEAGKITSSFAMGSPDLYRFLDDNPGITMLDCAYTNDTAVIRRHPKMTAINSAIEIDITGQVCADSIGTKIFSGFGGQTDFMRGAGLCPTGRPILALPSTTKNGDSRIVSMLKPGAGVVTSRAHVHYIVTEYGIAYLFGKSLRERAAALINISHPNHRAMLTQQAKERNIL